MSNNKSFFRIFLIYFIVLLAFSGVRIMSSFGVFSAIENPYIADVVSTLIIQVLILFLLPFILYMTLLKKSPKSTVEDFGYKKLNFKAVLICFGIGILAFVVNIFVSNLFSVILSYIGYNPTGSGSSGYEYDTFAKFLLGVVTVAIMPALCEEFLHRGMLLNGAGKAIGYKKAIIISSILFGLVHLNIQQVFYATILGLLMGFVVTMTRSIWPGVIIHFCNNFINVFLSYSESSDLFGFSLGKAINSLANQNVLLFFICAMLVVGIAVFGIIFLIKKLFMQTAAKRYNNLFEDIENQIRATNNGNVTDGDVVMAFERYIFPNMKSANNIFDLYIYDNGHYGNIYLKDKIPVISCFVLSVIITVFTFIWGVV